MRLLTETPQATLSADCQLPKEWKHPNYPERNPCLVCTARTGSQGCADHLSLIPLFHPCFTLTHHLTWKHREVVEWNYSCESGTFSMWISHPQVGFFLRLTRQTAVLVQNMGFQLTCCLGFGALHPSAGLKAAWCPFGL